MTSEELKNLLDVYLTVRSAIGRKDNALRILLKDFVAYLISNEMHHPILARNAVDWACISSATRGESGRSSRLSAARGFLKHLQASEPNTEIPDKYLLSSVKRRKPYILSEQEKIDLLDAASAIKPGDILRPHTYATIIGLMASTGLRVSEAIKLTVNDIHLNTNPPKIFVMETKFYKSRIVPLHSSTAKKLRLYQNKRLSMGYAGLSDAFFVSEKGKHINYDTLHKWFNRTTKRLNMHPCDDQGRSPTLHSLRHSFAVERLTRWCKEGVSTKDLLPNLSVYLGHVRLEDTYWYLTATPELLLTASELFHDKLVKGE